MGQPSKIISFPIVDISSHRGSISGAPTLTEAQAIKKADVLIEALGWIRQFRDKITVIKLGGSVMEDDDALRHLLLDIVFMETVGMRPVVVHGGGAAINRAMDAAGLKPRFIQGRRYTDDATLDIVEHVLAYETNEHIADADRRARRPGDAAQLPHDERAVRRAAARCPATSGEPIDLGHVGHGDARRSHARSTTCATPGTCR